MTNRPPPRFRSWVWVPCLVLMTAWPASTVFDGVLEIGLGHREVKIRNGAGWLSMTWMPTVGSFVGLHDQWHRVSALAKNDRQPRVFSSPGNYQFSCPIWVIVLVTAVAAASVTRVPGYRPPGLCPTCGYDLRATPGRCPECGAAAS